MVVFPLIYTAMLTFCDYNLTRSRGITFVGINNYINLFFNERFWHAVSLSLYYTGLSVGISFLVGFGVALLLNSIISFRWLYSTFLLIPMVMTPIIVGLGFRFMYSPRLGIISYFLSVLGIEDANLLGNPEWALITIILTDIWQWTPFAIAVLYAGLAYIPQEPVEAARVDGASSFQILRYITVPFMKIPIVTVLVIRSMDVMRSFDKVFIMTRGGPGLSTETLSIYSWRVGFAWFKMGEASTMGIFMLIVIIGISSILLRICGSKE